MVPAAMVAEKLRFQNNITFSTNATAPWTLNGNIDAGGNVLNQDPLMAAQTQVNSGVDDPLLNFTIASGPANNKATDGKDMGLLFDNTGNLNWSNNRNNRLPYVYDINITNPNIAPGGTLNITLEAKKKQLANSRTLFTFKNFCMKKSLLLSFAVSPALYALGKKLNGLNILSTMIRVWAKVKTSASHKTTLFLSIQPYKCPILCKAYTCFMYVPQTIMDGV